MAHELDVEKKMVGLNIERSLCRMVEKKFGRPEDMGVKSVAYIRALEEAVRGYHLTPQDYIEIAHETEKALERRMEKRGRKG